MAVWLNWCKLLDDPTSFPPVGWKVSLALLSLFSPQEECSTVPCSVFKTSVLTLQGTITAKHLSRNDRSSLERAAGPGPHRPSREQDYIAAAFQQVCCVSSHYQVLLFVYFILLQCYLLCLFSCRLLKCYTFNMLFNMLFNMYCPSTRTLLQQIIS